MPGMQPGLPALLDAATKCFCLGSSSHKHLGANSAITSLPQAAPDYSRDFWRYAELAKSVLNTGSLLHPTAQGMARSWRAGEPCSAWEWVHVLAWKNSFSGGTGQGETALARNKSAAGFALGF